MLDLLCVVCGAKPLIIANYGFHTTTDTREYREENAAVVVVVCGVGVYTNTHYQTK